MNYTKYAIIFLLFISCKNEVKHETKTDTAKTVALYLDASGMVHGDIVFRVTKDTFAFDTINAETAKRVWKRDTVYFVPTLVPVKDSSGNFVKDSTGNVKSKIDYMAINNLFILQDYNKKF